MNILDIFIILMFISGIAIGFKRGVIKQGVLTVGIFLVVILSFVFKNPLSIMLYEHCPFFTVGILKNYSVLNILLYELVSFCILLMIFSLILSIIIKISGLVERVVRATIVLALPSRILGAVLGFFEFYLFTFIILIIINMPLFTVSNTKFVKESKLKDKVLHNSLVISKVSSGMVDSISDINSLIKDEKKLGTKEFNCKALNVFVKNKIVSLESIDYLKNNNKIDKECKIK